MEGKTPENVVAETQAALRKSVREYTTKVANLNHHQLVDTAPILQYHYARIVENLQQIEFHLQEIENHCKKLNDKSKNSNRKSFVQERVRLFSTSRGDILTATFMEKVDEFFTVEASLQRTKSDAQLLSLSTNSPGPGPGPGPGSGSGSGPGYNRSYNCRTKQCDETML